MGLVNGIWEYDEGDSASPTFSELLNKLGDSVRDRFTAVIADLTADTGWIAVPPIAPFSSTGAQVRRIGNLVLFRGYFTGGALSTGGTNVGTVPAGYRPPTGVDGSVSAVGLGSGALARATVSAAGVISIIPPTNGTAAVYLKGLSGYTVN